MLYVWLISWITAGIVLGKFSKSKTVIGGGGLIISLVCVAVWASLTGVPKASHRTAPESPRKERKVRERPAPVELTREEKIRNQLSPWDGAHRNLERLIKKGMHDPDSYEHVETKAYDSNGKIVVVTKYRGKNAFGAVVLGSIRAEVDIDGNILSAIAEK